MLRSVIVGESEQARTLWRQWDELTVSRSRPYCSPAWMMAWWDHVAPPGAQLRLNAVFDGEQLVGVAPFFADRGPGGVRRYRLLGAGTSAPLDILAQPGMEQAAAMAMARSLSEADPSPDVIMLEGVAGDSPWPGLLCDLWPDSGSLCLRKQFSQPVPFIDLHGTTYDGWVAAKSSSARRKLRKDVKVLQELGVTVRPSRNAEELQRDLEALATLHSARWRKRGGSGVLDERVERMLAQAGRQLIDQGRFRVWSMELEGRTISAHLFVVAGGRVSYWLGGFDERETRIRQPGILTVRSALEHAFGAGASILDLGPGGQPYKYEFTQCASTAEWMLLIPRGRRSLLARAQMAPLRARMIMAQRLSPRAKRVVRRISSTVREWTRRVGRDQPRDRTRGPLLPEAEHVELAVNLGGKDVH